MFLSPTKVIAHAGNCCVLGLQSRYSFGTVKNEKQWLSAR